MVYFDVEAFQLGMYLAGLSVAVGLVLGWIAKIINRS